MTNPLATLNVCFTLGELEEDSAYQRMKAESGDSGFHHCRQSAELTAIGCRMLPPDALRSGEVEDNLNDLFVLARGPLAPYRQFIERAQAALVQERLF